MSPPEAVADLLKNATKPVTFAQLKKDTRLDQDALSSALEAAISQGAAFRWPDYSRRQYYWSQTPELAAGQAILTVTAKAAFSRANLFVEVRKQVPGFSRAAFEKTVTSLLSEGQIIYVPAFTAGKLLIKSGAPEAYAASGRAFLEQKFRKAGFEPPDLEVGRVASLRPIVNRPSDDAQDASASLNDTQGGLAIGRSLATRPTTELILETVRSLEPTGVPVSAQRLRSRLPSLGKADFDAAALELRKRQRVFLSLHNDPYNLPEPERDLLIDGTDGTYYVAIAIRG